MRTGLDCQPGTCVFCFVRTESDLKPHQREIRAHVADGYESAVFVRPGLGKTAPVLFAVADVLRANRDKGKFSRALVVAPRRVARDVWASEVSKWAELSHIRVEVAMGTPARRMQALTNPNADIVTINYENLAWLMSQFPKGSIPFDILIMDEIDKMKAPGTQRFRAFRHRIKEFEMRIGMTGTPATEGLLDLWAPSYIITGGVALGRSFAAFKRQYFEQLDYNGWKLGLRDGAHEAIMKRMSDWVYSLDEHPEVKLPSLVEVDHVFKLNAKARKRYDEMEKDLVLALDRGDATLDLSEFDEWDPDDFEYRAPNAAVKFNKLRQITSGFSYMPSSNRQGNAAVWLHTDKLDQLADIRSELMGRQVLIAYGYRAELDRVGLDGCLGGGTTDAQESEILRRWNAKELQALGLHPASAGHGLNLQETGASDLVYITLPCSGRLYDQTNGRLARMGQSSDTVIVHRLIAKDTVDEDVADALKVKGSVDRAVLASLRRRHG